LVDLGSNETSRTAGAKQPDPQLTAAEGGQAVDGAEQAPGAADVEAELAAAPADLLLVGGEQVHRRVDVTLSSNPVAGAGRKAVAGLLGSIPKQQLDRDLLQMKTLPETGRPPTTPPEH
jgi:uncharacterized membrane protein